MDIQKINIQKLKPAKYNPRIDLQPGDKEYQKIKKSIETFGYVEPIIVNKDMTVIGGHQRLKVLKELGYSEVECVVVNLNKNQEKALNIALNKIGGEWDTEKLEELLLELKNSDFDLNVTGFDEDEINDIFSEYDNDIEEDNFDVKEALEEIEEPVSKSGDMFKLGNHILMCGDSTNKEQVARLMNNKEADLLLTDPPYNINVSNSKGMKIENDNLEKEKFIEFITSCLSNAKEHMKEGAVFYIWYADTSALEFYTALKNVDLQIRENLIWVKNKFILGRSDYHWRHEPCLYGWKDGKAHYYVNNRKQSTVIDDSIDLNLMSIDEIKEYIQSLIDDSTIFYENKPEKDDLHPTMKPIKLIGKMIKNSSLPNQLVLDLFGGSGSTLIACEQLQRKCFMMEYDPKYCDVIIKRWEDFTGKKAIKI